MAPHARPTTREDAFSALVVEVEPRLRRALVGSVGLDDARDAVAEALAWAWEHWEEVHLLENPAGYLYRVAQSRRRQRRQGRLPARLPSDVPEVEPGLVPALASLPERQRVAVWLVHACDWDRGEVAEAMGISRSSVDTHVSRALASLRRALEVDDHG